MFPDGAPGLALVFLRLGVTACLWLPILEIGVAPTGARLLGLTILSVILLIGLATPLASVVTAINLLMSPEFLSMHGALIAAATHSVFALSLALIGPGAFSLDARLFGRRVLTSS